jgi:hypothetical protein
MLARHRVLPFAYDIMPGYDPIAAHYLPMFLRGLRELGSDWLTLRSINGDLDMVTTRSE